MNTEQKNQQTDNNNVRMTQINTYYGEQYKAYIELLKAVVLFSLSILILSILKSFIIIPDIILNGLMGLIIMLGIMYSLWLYYDITLRDIENGTVQTKYLQGIREMLPPQVSEEYYKNFFGTVGHPYYRGRVGD
jgi:hypothetical protein